MAIKQTKIGKGNRTKTPTVLQMEAVECGAASLSMVLGYYQRYLPLEVLRADVGISRDGAKASQVRNAALKHGLEFKAMKRDLDSLVSESPRPSILFWEFGHYVVFEGVTGKTFHINDPASGRRKLSEEDFSTAYTGVVLEFQPSDKFEKFGKRTGLFTGFLDWISGSYWLLLFPLLCGVLLAIPGVLVPGVTSVFVNEVVVHSRLHWTGGIVIALVGAALASVLLVWLQQYCLRRLQSRIFLKASLGMGEHMVRLPMTFFMQRMPGDLVSRLVSSQTISVNLTNGFANGLVNIITASLYAFAMLAFDFKIGLLTVIATVVLLTVVRMTDRAVMDKNSSLKKEVGMQYGTLMMMFRNIQEIKATSREMEVFSTWAGYQAKSANAQQEIGNIETWVNALPSFVNGLVTNVIVLTFGGFQVMNGELSLGGLVAMQMLAGLLIAPVQQLVLLAQTFRTTRADMERFDDVMNYDQDPALINSGSKEVEWVGGSPQRLSGKVEFKDVSFGFTPDQPPLLKGIDFAIEPGQWVAIVGGSGSGKSTVANLLVGLEIQWSGDILLDGVPILKILPEQRINSISGVSEEVTVFKGTIRENVTFWDHTITDESIIQAMHDAACEELLERPGGLDALLSEGGQNLSGGQRQRLEIARCLARNPSLMVLDGATSALDSKTETRIDQSLRSRGCSILLVANRLSTVRDADLILVMHEGEIVERGTHAELLAQGGRYLQLIGGGS